MKSVHHPSIIASFGKIERIRPLSWPEVKEIWRENEEHLEHWQRYWQSRNYKSWDEWRRKFFWRFNVTRADWALYRISSPPITVPRLKPGPFRGWRKLSGKNHSCNSFAELIINPAIVDHKPVQEFKVFLNDIPKTTIIGLCSDFSGKIMVIEGMHRCTAYTVSVLLDKKWPDTEFYIALGIGKERWLSRMLFKLGYI